ncbi:histidine kinase [Paenibacillus sp. GCM10027626]|uniref:sensor histidine kinase n=1 Tax=Paenibacillus sp. GCM10027626 TaxID=3273411 RepID=UPI00363B4AB2
MNVNVAAANLTFSIYTKLVLTLLMAVAPLYALSMSMNNSSSDTVRNEISKSTMSSVQFYMNALELEFARIIKLQQEYVNDDDLGKLAVAADSLNDIERMQAILRLQRRLVLLRDSSPYVSNASLLIPAIDRTISSNQLITEMDQQDFSALAVSVNRHEAPFIMYDGKMYTTVPFPEPALLSEGSQPLFLIALEINTAEIRSMLQQIAGNPQGGAVLIGDGEQWSIRSDELSNTEADEVKAALDRMMMKEDAAVTEGIRSIRLSGQEYLMTMERSAKIGATLFTYLPEHVVLGPLDQYKRWFWLLSFVSLVVIVFFSSLIYRFIHRPLKTLVRAFKKVEMGNLALVERYRFKDEFAYLFVQYNAMVEQLKVLIHEVYEQKYRAQLAELRQLQSQINPHFLYNSLFSIYRMAKSDDLQGVIRFSRHLGDYFQFITRDGQQEIPLATEADFARTYVEIQSVRFAHRVQVQFGEMDQELQQLKVPRLVLQPLIENAYHYGLENKKKAGLIRIHFELAGGLALIAVEDNGEELTDSLLQQLQRMVHSQEEPPESTGMYNVHRRLRIKFGDRGGLQLSRSELGGLKAQLVIPIQ